MKSTCLLIFFVALPVLADVVPQDRLIDWANQSGVEGGIPTNWTIYTNLPICSLAAINSAIDNCPSGQVVRLTNGYYDLHDSIELDKSGVILRGRGMNSTFLSFDDTSSGYGDFRVGVIAFNDPCCYTPDNVVNWTSGYSQGTSNIVLSSTAGLTVGKLLMLDQYSTNTTKNYIVHSTNSPGEGHDATGRELGKRGQVEMFKVVAVDGTTVTLDRGLYFPNWTNANSPQAWWYNGGETEYAGLEDMTITNELSGTDKWAVSFTQTRNCWAKGVRTENTGVGCHYRTYLVHRLSIEECRIGKSSDSSMAYGVSAYWAHNGRMVNCISDGCNGPWVGEQATGWVISYNYATNLVWNEADWLQEGFAQHAVHCGFNLIEGNHTPHIYLDCIHGSGSHTLIHRNRIIGQERSTTASTRVVPIERWNRYCSVIGNVLGKLGYHTVYERACSETRNNDHVFDLGYQDTDPSGTTNCDALTVSTLIRHMNYDTATTTNSGVVWFTNSTTITNSYYLTSKPAWFGNLTWPPFDPSRTNTAQNSMTNIPAGFRWAFGTNPPAGSEGGGTPSPRNLRVTGTLRATTIRGQ